MIGNLNNELVKAAQNTDDADVDYDYFNAIIEDKIFEIYNLEYEDIAAYYAQPGNEELNDTIIDTLKSGTSKLLSLNRSIIN